MDGWMDATVGWLEGNGHVNKLVPPGRFVFLLFSIKELCYYF
jgi:hypothetical protein